MHFLPPSALTPPHHHYVPHPPPPPTPPVHPPPSAKRLAPSPPPALRPARKRGLAAYARRTNEIPAELGEYIDRDMGLLQSLGWHGLVAHRRPLSDFSKLDRVHHPARRLLRLYKHRGAPVKFSTSPWTLDQVTRTLVRGLHASSHDYIDYLREEFVDMINKGQWLVLPYSAIRHLPGLRISPLVWSHNGNATHVG